MRPNVVVLYHEATPPQMIEMAELAEIRPVRAASLGSALQEADALLMWDFTSTVLGSIERFPERLRWIHVAAAGVDRALVPAVRDSERIIVTNSRGVFDRSIAEYVAGLVLAFAKDFPGTLRMQQDKIWRHRETEMVSGRTAIVVGAGPIGREIARLLEALGLEVSLVGRTARDDVIGADRLHEVLPMADFVIVAVPLTPATESMFDAAAFAAMQPTARFVNVGRGDVVVESDLLEALQSGQIAGAALDVFRSEPLNADSPFWTMPNVIVSPHMSADFVGWLDALALLFVANLRRFVAGEALRNVVDKTLGYVKE